MGVLSPKLDFDVISFDAASRWQRCIVIPDFKDKTRYAPYVSFRSQVSHIATNEG